MSNTTVDGKVLCGWRGIPREGILFEGQCSNVATLTGQNISSGEQHLCTEHMILRDQVGYGLYRYTWVWPCKANNLFMDDLSSDAAARCR